MVEKVTYILGAGASIGKFPVVKGSKEWEQKGLADILYQAGEKLKIFNPSILDAGVTRDRISAALIDIGAKAREFGNVDSYAKYLFHKKEHWLLLDLKLALTYFFVRQQVCEPYCFEKKEGRYLNFITSLVTKASEFPSHVKILSWNYDFLLGKEGMLYNQNVSKGVNLNRGEKITPFFKYFPSADVATKKPVLFDNLYSVIYLNGIAGYYADVDADSNGFFRNTIIELLKGDLNQKITEHELLNYFHSTIRFNPLITFAWEGELDGHIYLGNRTENAATMAKDTSILVVVGYSFPFYNREIDNAIFKAMKPTLRRIYFQDPNLDGQFLRNRYGLEKRELRQIPGKLSYISGVDIENITYTDQFYIPVEV